jgi:hypothetical protein
MLKKLVFLMAALFLVTIVGNAFAETEDEIIARYLKKTEKKHVKKVGFFSTHFSYGFLPKDQTYRQFNFSASSDLATISGLVGPQGGIWRSNEFGLSLGMMLTPKAAFNLGFDYWLSMGEDYTVDYNATFGILSTDVTYNNDNKISVYGFKTGVDYYLWNAPDKFGHLSNIAVTLGGGAGYYFSRWNLWEENNTDSEPLKSSALGLWIRGGIEYPFGFWDMVVGANISYFYLNFSDIKSYNEDSGDLTLTYPGDGSELELDFSGIRGSILLKKFVVW